jgi:HSP20 family molecular chaperone IbpA
MGKSNIVVFCSLIGENTLHRTQKDVHSNTTTPHAAKYHRSIEIPAETDIETAKSTYNNGILEITFEKKEQTKEKTIKIASIVTFLLFNQTS